MLVLMAVVVLMVMVVVVLGSVVYIGHGLKDAHHYCTIRGARLNRGLSTEALQRVLDCVAPGGRILRYRPLRGGVSASVYAVYIEASDGTRQAVVVRRYDGEWYRTNPDRCTREFKVLDELTNWSFPAPRPLLLE